MRVAHKKNRHLRVLLWKWDTASRLSFRRTEHLLNSERNLPRGTNKYLCLKNQQKPFCFDVCFQSCVKMFLGLFEAQICSCDPPLVGAAGKRVSPCPHSNSEREYSRKKSRQFAAGGLAGQLLFISKGWFGHREQVIRVCFSTLE
jgi:hypothetical protein